MTDTIDKGPVTRADLQFKYEDKTTPGDNPKFIHHTDSDLLNRYELYEMLTFINRFASNINFPGMTPKQAALKTEWLIRGVMPGAIHGQGRTFEWLIKNWNAYRYPPA